MIKSVNAPAIGQEGIDRLLNTTRRKPLQPGCTLFDAGYEQAKADIRERIVAEIGRPADDIQTAEHAVTVPTPERAARQHLSTGRRWWHL